MSIAMATPMVGTEGESAQTVPLDELNRKLDRMSEQIQFLADQAEQEKQRRMALEDLQSDVAPILRDLYAVAEEEMTALRPHVEIDDLFHLLRRLTRSVRSFNHLLDQLESVQDLLADLTPLSKEMIDGTVLTLDELEGKGYFGFLRQSGYVMDRIVTSFDENDVRLLGDNIVTILNTVKALTQPEILALATNLTTAFEEVEEGSEQLPTSLFGLLGQLRDPEVRRGLSVTLAMLKVIARQQPGVAHNN